MTSGLLLPGAIYRLRADRSALYSAGYPDVLYGSVPPPPDPPAAMLALLRSFAVAGSGATQPNPDADQRPAPGTYPRQYRYEDVYTSGQSFQQVMNAAAALHPVDGTNVVLTMPAGVFDISDFAVSFSAGSTQTFGYGARIPVNLSLAGSGSKGTYETRLRLVPNSSTKAESVPQPGSGKTNGLSIIGIQNNGTTSAPAGNFIKNLSVIGTHQPPTTTPYDDGNGNMVVPADPDGQGHRYNGIRIQNATDFLMEDVYLEGCAGNQAAPPGETFGINAYQGARHTYRRVEVDGRRTRQGQTVSIGSSPFGWNAHQGLGSLVEDCYFHHNQYGMPTTWLTNDVIWRNNRSEYNRTGWNHERVLRATHINPRVLLGGLRPHHFTLMNDQADGKLTIQEVIRYGLPGASWDISSASASGKLVINQGPRGSGIADLQTTLPSVTDVNGNQLVTAASSPYVLVAN